MLKNLLADALQNKSSLLIGKIGTIECNILYMLNLQTGIQPHLEFRDVLEINAGVFPNDYSSVEHWAKEFGSAIMSANCLATGWYEHTKQQEDSLFRLWGWKGHQVPLRALEPYYADEEERWTSLLEGQRVCVVTSFSESARKQVEKGEERVWPMKKGSVWPSSVEWSWVQTGYSPRLALGRAGWEESPEDWSEAVSWVVAEVLKTEARIVLIGCGALGMLIGARLKQKGKICIVLGGALQVLFGIKGRRWENHSIISKFWNSEWVWPSTEETPRGSEGVEKSCYWN
jgi:hypothetical protein